MGILFNLVECFVGIFFNLVECFVGIFIDLVECFVGILLYIGHLGLLKNLFFTSLVFVFSLSKSNE